MNIYICSKPLQIMICMILNNRFYSNSLYIVDAFYDSKKIADCEELKKIFKQVLWFKSKNDALLAAAAVNPDMVYIDSDVGLRNFFNLCRLKVRSIKTQINVYEEGIGTYRTDIIKNKLKKGIFLLMGVGVHFGGFFLTKKIYAFNPESYKFKISKLNHKVVKINKNFSCWLYENQKKLVNIFSPDFKIEKSSDNTVARLYLADWNIDINFINKNKKSRNFFVKPHPHTKLNNLSYNDDYILVPASLPAEILIILIIKEFDHLEVFHTGSSSIEYVVNKKIKYINLNEKYIY